MRAAIPAQLPGGQDVMLIAADNPGYAGGVNRCLDASPDADAWWVLNPDTRPDPGALAALLARLAQGDVQAAGATLYLPDGRVQAYGGRWQPELARSESIGWGRTLADPVDAAAVERKMTYIHGASMLVSRAFLATAGPMREDYFLYCEEIEWFERARALGLRLGFAPDAKVLHLQGTTTGAAAGVTARSRLSVFLDERNKINVIRDTKPALLWCGAPAALLIAVRRFALRRAWRQFGYALSGWAAGLRDERDKPRWMTPQRRKSEN